MDLPVFIPFAIEPHLLHSYHIYNLLLDIDNLKIIRDQFLDEMHKRNIGVGCIILRCICNLIIRKNLVISAATFLSGMGL